jgi:uncharacterized protein (DUF362 family)
MPGSQVSLIRGDDRYQNLAEALALLDDQVDLSGKKRVLVKPNFVVTHKPLASTHADALRAVLEFVRARYDGPLTIAEGPSVELASEGFRRLGYEPLAEEYGATLLDLNHDDPVPVDVYDWQLRPLRLHLARSVVESDFRISVGLPKTHDVVIVTLSLKNMIMGSLISRFTHQQASENGSGSGFGRISKALWPVVPKWVRHSSPLEWLQFRAMRTLQPSDKMKMHQSHPVINLNLACLAPVVWPHLAVLDGFEAMEGNGPTDGEVVPLHVALASTDALAADVVATSLMGFDANDVGYLNYCKRMNLGVGDLAEIKIIGNVPLTDCARPFHPHDTYQRQRRWGLAQVKRYLRPAPLLDTRS